MTLNLKDTTWVVPPNTLLAYSFDKNTYTAVVDQTVWTIDNQQGNYFFGYLYANINGTYSKAYLTGSILPNNNVQINFENVISGSSIVGVGKFEKCKFQMQMVTDKNFYIESQTIHASYMVKVKPGDKCYEKLPGSETFNDGKYLSVPEFIKKCDESIQQTKNIKK